MKNHPRKFTIDEICALVEMNKRTVRYYIQVGLVDCPVGTEKGAYYNHTHLELLAIKKWKAAGLSLERIREILGGERNVHRSGKPIPPPLAKTRGTVEVWSHMYLDDGIELHIEPGRAGLSPEQVRTLFREMTSAYRKIREEKP